MEFSWQFYSTRCFLYYWKWFKKNHEKYLLPDGRWCPSGRIRKISAKYIILLLLFVFLFFCLLPWPDHLYNLKTKDTFIRWSTRLAGRQYLRNRWLEVYKDANVIYISSFLPLFSLSLPQCAVCPQMPPTWKVSLAHSVKTWLHSG